MFSSSSENEDVEELGYSHSSVNQESGKAQTYLRSHVGDLEAFEIGLVLQKIEGDSFGAGISWVGFVDNALWIHREGMQVMINERHIGTDGYEGKVVGHGRMSRAVHLPCFLPHSVRLVSLNAKLKFGQTFDIDPLPEGNTVEAIQHFVNYLKRFPVVKRLLS